MFAIVILESKWFINNENSGGYSTFNLSMVLKKKKKQYHWVFFNDDKTIQAPLTSHLQ